MADRGVVPLPPYNVNGRQQVFDLRNDDHRRFLTGGLAPPVKTRDGWGRCSYCDGKVGQLLIHTHVPGAQPVRVLEDHACRSRVA